MGQGKDRAEEGQTLPSRPLPSKRQIIYRCSFIHFTNILSTYCMPGTLGGVKGTVLDEIGRVLHCRPTLWGKGHRQ